MATIIFESSLSLVLYRWENSARIYALFPPDWRRSESEKDHILGVLRHRLVVCHRSMGATTGKRQSKCRRYGVGADFVGPRDVDDAGPGVFLLRDGAAQERAGHDYAQLHSAGTDHGAMGVVGLHAGLRAGRRGSDWETDLDRLARRGRCAEPGLRADDSARGVHGLSNDVCDHHSRVDFWRRGGTHEILGDGGVFAVVGHVG